MSKAARVAELVATRAGRTVPVAVRDLVEAKADVVELDWRWDCDALLSGLGVQDRPTLFLRSSSPPLRQRFTLAHELGHISLAWHLGTLGCSAEPVEDAEEDAGASHWEVRRREAEASDFASRLLIPRWALESAFRDDNMEDALEELDALQVSAAALVLRLRRALLPGFAFSVADGWRPGQLTTSSGTQLPRGPSQGDDGIETLARHSESSGAVTVSGRTIRWFVLQRNVRWEPDSDERGTTELLRVAIRRHQPDGAMAHKWLERVNGVAGGSLSKGRFMTIDQALVILRHKFEAHPDFAPLLDEPEFELYLGRKAQERMDRLRDG